jgi:hypothetical protein
MAAPGYVRYTDSLQQPKPDWEKTSDELAATVGRITACHAQIEPKSIDECPR